MPAASRDGNDAVTSPGDGFPVQPSEGPELVQLLTP
jgi:hypothetical protein